MNILVIGSKGFIGSHCVEYFSKNHNVFGCDVIYDFNAPNYIIMDSVGGNFENIFIHQQFDVCINCSGAASVPFSMEHPLNDFNLNTLNVIKILDAIRLYSPGCKYISMSSAAVYGNPKRIPIHEEDDLAPVSPYGFHKVAAEKICLEYSKFWNVKTCMLRVFSAYGPGLRKQLFWDLYKKFTTQDTIELWGTGHETRDFIYISDLVRIIDLAINNSTFNGDIVNVANGVQSSISEVARAFVSVLGTNKTIRFNGNVRAGDPLNWEANVDKIKSWGYVRKVSLIDGIKNYVSWVEEQK